MEVSAVRGIGRFLGFAGLVLLVFGLLSFALTRRKWGKPQKTVHSRFLYEMTGQAENFPPAKEPEKKSPGRRRTSVRC